MQRVAVENPVYYQFENLHAVRHGVFTRLGGVSADPWGTLNLGGTVGDSVEAVRENHRRMYDTLELDAQAACTVWQVHGADTVVVTGNTPHRKWLNRADGMVTNKPGLPIVMRFADCVPLLYHDPVQNVVGIAHAGWRGTVDGAQISIIETMQAAYGCNPADIRVGIGPSIGPERYQVGEEVVEAFVAVFGSPDGLFTRADDGTAYLNLWEANRRRLADAGVVHIEISGICTATRTDEFFSHRAEKGKTGRFGAVIAL